MSDTKTSGLESFYSVLAGSMPFLMNQALATEEQYQFEATAEAIIRTPEMQGAMEEARQMFLASPLANSESGKRTLEQAIAECAGYAALTAATKDADKPGLVWIQTPKKEWLGHKVSGSRFSFDNPDNIYRYSMIDGEATYVLDIKPTGPVGRISIAIYQALTGAEVDDWEKQVIDAADAEEIKFDAEGAARITIGPVDPKDGSTYMNSRGGNLIFMREALNDWQTMRPRIATLRKIAGPKRHATFEDRVAIAQRYMIFEARTIIGWDEIVYPLPTNKFARAVMRGHGVKPAMMNIGRFHIADDEALVANLASLDAEYRSFSVASPWQVTRNFLDKTCTRTSTQSHRNADGTYTYVLSRRDPGVANWMDTDGLLDGGMAMRWEGINAPAADPNDAIKSVKHVKLDTLRSELPANFPSVSPEERRAEQAQRRADYETRCGVPCRLIEDW